jgi:hypothetical protein
MFELDHLERVGAFGAGIAMRHSPSMNGESRDRHARRAARAGDMTKDPVMPIAICTISVEVRVVHMRAGIHEL